MSKIEIHTVENGFVVYDYENPFENGFVVYDYENPLLMIIQRRYVFQTAQELAEHVHTWSEEQLKETEPSTES